MYELSEVKMAGIYIEQCTKMIGCAIVKRHEKPSRLFTKKVGYYTIELHHSLTDDANEQFYHTVQQIMCGYELEMELASR